jgi:very-short-patch-repair endonuclease
MYKTACPDRYDILKDLARKNRNYPTLAESLLWKRLKGKSLGVKFLRQHPVLDFIPDFICIEKSLIVEVDGGYHTLQSQMVEDEMRTKRLSDMGYKVIRFTNEEVLHNTDSVIDQIKLEIE